MLIQRKRIFVEVIFSNNLIYRNNNKKIRNTPTPIINSAKHIDNSHASA